MLSSATNITSKATIADVAAVAGADLSSSAEVADCLAVAEAVSREAASAEEVAAEAVPDRGSKEMKKEE